MRTKTLFAAILAVGLIFLSGCRQDEDYVLPAIDVKSEALSFDAETEQTLMFTATRDWRVLDAPEWVTIAPDHGSGSQETQRVLVSAEPNSGYNRSGEFTLTIGLAKARIAVSQPGAKGEIPVGSGTLADPYTVAGVLKFIGTLGNDVESPEDVYVKGFVASVTEAFSTQFGNATFTIKEEKDGEASPIFTFYRGLYLGNKKWTANDKQIAVGDEVIVCGRVVNFKGNTPETQQNKAYIYSLNGETQGSGGDTPDDTPAGVIFSQAFKTAGQGDFTIDNKTLPEGLEFVWSYDSKYGMKASAFANSKNFAAESWLVSPAIDLSGAKKPVLTFRHALNFFTDVNKAKEEASLWAKPEGGEWAKLSGVTYPESLSWTFVDSGEIDLSAYAGKKIQVAFRYVSTAEKAGTWEVDAFSIAEK